MLIRGVLFFLVWLWGWAITADVYADDSRVPWVDNEILIYEIKWGLIHAAEGMFRVEDRRDRWKFSLNLKTVGIVDSIYPIRSQFVSIQQKHPWRSMAYYENRNENRKVRRTRSVIDYARAAGVFLNEVSGERKVFDFKDRLLDDIGSAIYGSRLVDWNKTQQKKIRIHEKGEVKTGWIRSYGCVQESVAGWPKQRLWRLYAEPEKGEMQKGNVRVWLTDDKRRIPLYARVKFRYGTFDIELKEALPYGLILYSRSLNQEQSHRVRD
jgi:hypothetical protein